jgi:hypothetical protein
MSLTLRKAALADIPALNALIAGSARGLSTEDCRAAQIEGALRGAGEVVQFIPMSESLEPLEPVRVFHLAAP